jgi:hypothetical protein
MLLVKKAKMKRKTIKAARKAIPPDCSLLSMAADMPKTMTIIIQKGESIMFIRFNQGGYVGKGGMTSVVDVVDVVVGVYSVTLIVFISL